MTEYPFGVYSAFSDSAFGGCAAGILDQASELTGSEMLQIAREIGVPATCFITGISPTEVSVRFFSPLSEYPMCGHATIGLMTWLKERGFFIFDDNGVAHTRLSTPDTLTDVEVQQREDGCIEVLLSLPPAEFVPAPVGSIELSHVLGIESERLESNLEMTMTTTDFRSLLVPIDNVSDLEAVRPDFQGIEDLCRGSVMDTIFLFSPKDDDLANGIRCREFCPAVGTPESAASGTTNRSISCYLYEQNRLTSARDGVASLSISQGKEVGRPSNIRSVISLQDGQVNSVGIGGVATRVVNGAFFSPF
ncbi:MAG: PhzF family phenazine biosynthesis protein [Proteobacteria bacterium]|jgi:trans-2,3-dihydro-3-hydroxyanthranilate isomerase|nr:PhzF family phenazine biosynthesis protein [Pseudomonadota bacterium]MBT5817697.1 PhzF family phenazine biosynthesis protein [Pseudomonadota bacterium]